MVGGQRIDLSGCADTNPCALPIVELANSMTQVAVIATAMDTAIRAIAIGTETPPLITDANTQKKSAAARFDLVVGTTQTLTIIVVPQSGVAEQRTYTLPIVRVPEEADNADLSAITLTPPSNMPFYFNKDIIKDYIISTSQATTQITVMATASQAQATVQIGEHSALGRVQASISVAEQTTTTIVITVVSPSTLKTKRYTLVVERGDSSEAQLQSLALYAGQATTTNLMTAFAAGTLDYDVGIYGESLRIKATALHKQAMIALRCKPTCGITPTATASIDQTIALPSGVAQQTITIIVSAEDGTTQSYTVRAKRVLSSDTALKTVQILQANGELIKAYAFPPQHIAPEIATTQVQVIFAALSTTSTATATKSDESAYESGELIALVSGTTETITITVRAENGHTDKYHVSLLVNRSLSQDKMQRGIRIRAKVFLEGSLR